MVAEDDVDLESLQAQVDMAMSFAHDLVTSWIEPTHPAQLSSGGFDASQILEEELRRPPRLGVGASIPMAQPMAHEAYKLSRRLRKHGAKSEGVMGSQSEGVLGSDDEEHKGRPAKRKTKVDPFGYETSKKKRKANLETDPHLFTGSGCDPPLALLESSSSGGPKDHSLSSGKDKQEIEQATQRSYAIEEQRSTTLVSSPSVRLPVQATFFPSLTCTNAPPLSEPSRETSDPQAPVPAKMIAVWEPSRAGVNATLIHDKAKPFGIPLLNLDGPPGLTDEPGDASELANPRKKRKRRKKRRTRTITGTGDNSH